MAVRHQVFMKLEASDGVKETLVAADALTLAERPTFTTPTQFRERENQSGSLSLGKSVPGRTDFQAQLAIDLIGSRDPKVLPDLSTPPPIRSALLNGGFKETSFGALYVVTKSHSGTFVPGETVSWTQGGPQTAVVVNYSRPHAGNVGLLVLVSPTNVILDNDIITGSAAQNPPTATSNGIALLRQVYKYLPISDTNQVLTANHGTWTGIGTVAAGDLLIRTSTAYVEQTGWQPLGVLTEAPTDLTSGNYRFRFSPAVFAIQFSVGDRFAVKKQDGTIVNFGGTAPAVATIAAGDGPSATIQDRLEGKIHRTGVGCRSDLTIRATAGETAVLQAAAAGSFYESVAGAFMAGVTDIDLANIPLFELAACTLDGRPFPGSQFQLAMSSPATTRPDYHGASGLRGASITARAPVITLDPDLTHPTVFDWDSKVRGATSIAFACQIGWQASNGFLIKAANCQVTSSEDGERDGVATKQVTLAARRTTDNDEVEIIAF